MDSKSSISGEQLSTILQTFFQNIVTKEDLKNFATRDDILQLQQNQPDDKKGAGPNSTALKNLRQQITDNQSAIDSLYQEMASNKKLLSSINSEIKDLCQTVTFLKNDLGEVRENLIRMQQENQTMQAENGEVLHNVEANTRVIGKMASVVTDLSAKIEQVVTKDEIKFFRNEIIERLDGIIRRFEVFEQEQVSLKSAMKRMEKIQREEAQRNDSQDENLKIQQEKISRIEQKISNVS